MPNVDPVLYLSASREQNISLCAIMSITRIEYHKIIDGGCDQVIFNDFIRESEALGIFDENTVLVTDNVRFYKCGLLKSTCEELNIQTMFSLSYSPELNPIENLFQRLYRI
ncbi:hypothetical protein DMUE_0327 [Dictyocoela muelleri]|nr:hypothetical protein DMUE_0327 [Dictyocoela muelleri]